MLVLGPMFSGKSSELIAAATRHRGLYRDAGVHVFKPSCDTRGSEDAKVATPQLETHSGCGVTLSATPISNAGDVGLVAMRPGDMVILDELHMWGNQILAWLHDKVLQNPTSGLTIVAAGLAGDSEAKPWPLISSAVSLATEIKHLKSRCELCGGLAPFTRANFIKTTQFCLGGAEKYGARCGACHGAPDIVHVIGAPFSGKSDAIASLRAAGGGEFEFSDASRASSPRRAVETARSGNAKMHALYDDISVRREREHNEMEAIGRAWGTRRVVVCEGSTDSEELFAPARDLSREGALIAVSDRAHALKTRTRLRRSHLVITTSADMCIRRSHENMGGSLGLTEPTDARIRTACAQYETAVSDKRPGWYAYSAAVEGRDAAALSVAVRAAVALPRA
jgi:thymidine kinase